jgi:hypothetical protein
MARKRYKREEIVAKLRHIVGSLKIKPRCVSYWRRLRRNGYHYPEPRPCWAC